MDGLTVLIAVFIALAGAGVWISLMEARKLGVVFDTLAAKRSGSVHRHAISYPELRLRHRGRLVLVTATTGGSSSRSATLVRAWLESGTRGRFEVETKSLGSKVDGLLKRSMKPVSFESTFSSKLEARAEEPGFLRKILGREQRSRLLEVAGRWPARVALRLGPVALRDAEARSKQPGGQGSHGGAPSKLPAITLLVERVLTSREDYDLLIDALLAILDRVSDLRPADLA